MEHIGLRFAEGTNTADNNEYSGDMSLFWKTDDVLPDINSAVYSSAYSTALQDKEAYKSVVVECAWDKVKQVHLLIL